MGPYLMRFQIRDLEQFTGVKAHTIRVWERRYGLLKPDRTDTNIRTYDVDELKTILNVAYLNQRGLKISKLAAMAVEERERKVQELAAQESSPDGALNTLVMAMLSFDEELFERSCDEHERLHGFRSLVEGVLVKLLERIGLLWQSSAICPSQEHFVSNLVRQRIIVATSKLPKAASGGPLNVLYLPEDEIHELGLLYVHYLLRAQGQRTVYLGQSVPSGDLMQVASLYDGPIRFVSLFVVRPAPDEAPAYLKALRESMPDDRITFLVAGMPLQGIQDDARPRGFSLQPNLASVIELIAGPR
ncbi:MAG TPA: MerR family transcriptional regulator [Flavobacteriales bacterium]|nr:MerR family transcriptional regulator [Flavobacteriales bacterium]